MYIIGFGVHGLVDVGRSSLVQGGPVVLRELAGRPELDGGAQILGLGTAEKKRDEGIPRGSYEMVASVLARPRTRGPGFRPFPLNC